MDAALATRLRGLMAGAPSLTAAQLADAADADVHLVQEWLDLSEAAGVVAADSRPFEMRLGGCGCFPPRGRVRIVHVAVAEPSGALQDCRDHCEKVFADLGFAPERRPFSPHLTVGRVREDRTDGGLRRAVPAGPGSPGPQTEFLAGLARGRPSTAPAAPWPPGGPWGQISMSDCPPNRYLR